MVLSSLHFRNNLCLLSVLAKRGRESVCDSNIKAHSVIIRKKLTS